MDKILAFRTIFKPSYIHYSFNCKIFNGCIDYILDNKLLDYRFTSYFDDIDYGLEDAEEQQIKEKLITSMKMELDSADPKIRDNAVNKFKLFEKIIIDSECYEQILDKVWNQVDEFGLPLNSTYLPIAWVEDKKHEAEEKTIAYLLNPQISSDYHEGVISSGGNADGQLQGYCTVLYRMLKIKNNNIFSGEQLCDIVKYFNDYVKNEKKIIDRDFDIMGQTAQTKDRLNKINNIVMLLCISAKVSNLYTDSTGKYTATVSLPNAIGSLMADSGVSYHYFDLCAIYAYLSDNTSVITYEPIYHFAYSIYHSF